MWSYSILVDNDLRIIQKCSKRSSSYISCLSVCAVITFFRVFLAAKDSIRHERPVHSSSEPVISITG